MKLFFGNFDFEHQLVASAPRTLPASIERINAELACTLVTIAEAEDLIWAPQPPEENHRAYLREIGLPEVRFVRDAQQVPAGTQLCPWGWTSHLLAWGERSGWRCDCPDPAVVATANSREFSSNLELEWGVGLPQARAVHTLEEFHEAVACTSRKFAAWVVKANFGMSARERHLGRGSSPSEQAVNWVQRRFARNEAVYFEPWVERIEERGFQFTIPPRGEPVLEGVTPLLTDAQGTYRGSRVSAEAIAFTTPRPGGEGRLRGLSAHSRDFHPSPSSARSQEGMTEPPLEIVERAVRRVQQLGYIGPIGVDAMQYVFPDGEVRWRLLQDINARLTMGRLALGLRRLTAPNEHASWLQVRLLGSAAEIRAQIQRMEQSLPPGARAIRTSPTEVGGQPTSHGTVLVIAPSAETLLSAEKAVLLSNHPLSGG